MSPTFHPLTMTSLDVMYCSCAYLLHYIQSKNSYQDGNSLFAKCQLMVLVWACYKLERSLGFVVNHTIQPQLQFFQFTFFLDESLWLWSMVVIKCHNPP